MKYFHEIKRKKLKPDARSFNVAIDAAGRLQDIATMQLIYTQMQKLKVRPSAITMTIMLDAYAKSGNTAESLKLVEELKNSTISLKYALEY